MSRRAQVFVPGGPSRRRLRIAGQAVALGSALFVASAFGPQSAAPEDPPEPDRRPELQETLDTLVVSPPSAFEAFVQAAPAPPPPPAYPARPARAERTLARIRACESGGNYRARSASGRYRGAYQMDRYTFASVGGSGDPAVASPAEQDHRAWLLLKQRGRSPWPVCGRVI